MPLGGRCIGGVCERCEQDSLSSVYHYANATFLLEALYFAEKRWDIRVTVVNRATTADDLESMLREFCFRFPEFQEVDSRECSQS